jgi:predicted DNA-binding transcriptional regulator AlpA
MKEIVDVLNTARAPRNVRLKAQQTFLTKRNDIWNRIQDGKFPKSYVSIGNKRFVGAPRRTAIRCDFLLASKIVLGRKYMKDKISDLAQRDLLFSVLRDREAFPNRTGNKFYCCPKCTGKLYECVSFKVFRYVDNAKWKSAIEAH